MNWPWNALFVIGIGLAFNAWLFRKSKRAEWKAPDYPAQIWSGN